MPQRKLIAGTEARPAKRQHTKPCSDCPWHRESLPGWLGGLSADAWLCEAHGEAVIECHTRLGMQCAGAAIYRANVCKTPRSITILRLPADKERVFATPFEFRDQHESKLL